MPPTTRVLIAELTGVGRDYPLSIEKLCPVLSFYVVADWREGCERCKEILRYGGMGHTMSIHSRNDDVILQFGLKKPAFRIVVNTPTTHGSIGLTTGLDPAMTLGCGGYGGNITSDNISPMHLLNIKRLAYEVTPVSSTRPAAPAPAASAAAAENLPKAPRPTGGRRHSRGSALPPDRSIPGVPRLCRCGVRPQSTFGRQPELGGQTPFPRRPPRRSQWGLTHSGEQAARLRVRRGCPAGAEAGAQDS